MVSTCIVASCKQEYYPDCGLSFHRTCGHKLKKEINGTMGVIIDNINEKYNESFRICVNLSKFFEDERARCYISVQGHRPVRWLRRRLRKLFDIPKSVSLLSHDHLLPPDEPLSLLRPDDPVEVIMSHHANKTRHVEDDSENSSQELCEIDHLPKKKKIKLSKQETDSFQAINDNHSNSIEINGATKNIIDDLAMQQSMDVTDGVINDKVLPTDTIQLQNLKDQALALLESFEQAGKSQETETTSSHTRRVRRRVRRRRRPRTDCRSRSRSRSRSQSRNRPDAPPQPDPGPLPPDLQPREASGLESNHPPNEPGNSPQPLAPEIPPPLVLSFCEKRSAVIRNDLVVPRTPRVVRPLSVEDSGVRVTTSVFNSGIIE